MLVSKLIALSLLIPVQISIQISVPTECAGLALKHGFSNPMDKDEAYRAKRKLEWLRVSRPFNTEIRDCKRAVDELVRGILAQ